MCHLCVGRAGIAACTLVVEAGEWRNGAFGAYHGEQRQHLVGGFSHFFQVAVGYGALHALDVFPRFFGKREHNLARGVGIVGAERCQCGEVECVGLVICHGSLNHVDNFLLAERLVQTSGKAFATQRVYVHVAACGHGYYGN